MARLEAAIGLARQRPEGLNETLDRIEREAVRLDQLVGELLTLSRMQAGMARVADEEIDLVELLREVADDARFEAEATGRQVEFVGEGEALVIANVELLHRALENVVRNAVKFTKEGSTVEVEIAPQTAAGRLLVTVSDRGPGVPEGELQAIFEPFFRSADQGQDRRLWSGAGHRPAGDRGAWREYSRPTTARVVGCRSRSSCRRSLPADP